MHDIQNRGAHFHRGEPYPPHGSLWSMDHSDALDSFRRSQSEPTLFPQGTSHLLSGGYSLPLFLCILLLQPRGLKCLSKVCAATAKLQLTGTFLGSLPLLLLLLLVAAHGPEEAANWEDRWRVALFSPYFAFPHALFCFSHTPYFVLKGLVLPPFLEVISFFENVVVENFTRIFFPSVFVEKIIMCVPKNRIFSWEENFWKNNCDPKFEKNCAPKFWTTTLCFVSGTTSLCWRHSKAHVP